MRTAFVGSFLSLALSLGLSACADDKSAEDGETSSSEAGEGESGEESGETTGEPGECPAPFESMEPNADPPPPYVECALAKPCDAVSFDLDASATTGGEDELQNAEALTCVLEALDAGTIGEYSFTVSSYISSETVVVRVYVDGHMEWSVDGVFDSAWWASRSPGALDASYDFAACDAMSDWDGVWDCVRMGFAACEMWDERVEECPA